MTVEELVEEGAAFRVNHPAASARGVRAHLEKLIEPTRDEERDRVGRVVAAGPEGCFAALLLMPAVGAYRAVRRRRHHRRVEKAMRVLFPKGG